MIGWTNRLFKNICGGRAEDLVFTQGSNDAPRSQMLENKMLAMEILEVANKNSKYLLGQELAAPP